MGFFKERILKRFVLSKIQNNIIFLISNEIVKTSFCKLAQNLLQAHQFPAEP